MLKGKIDWNHAGKKSNFTRSQGTGELKLMRELTWRQSNQSEKAEVVNYYYQYQSFEPSGKRKAKRSVTVSVKPPRGTEEKAALKGITGMSRLRGSVRCK
jgi:hypothetical protein